MLYPTGVALYFEGQFTSARAGKSGLTVTISLVRHNTDGTRTVVFTRASATAATEIDATNQPGVYGYLLASGNTGTAGGYIAYFHTSDTTVDLQDVPAFTHVGPAWVANAATALQPGGTVGTVTNPVTVGTNNDKSGYSLTVAPPTAAAIDTLLTSSHGTGTWQQGNTAVPDNTGIAAIKAKTDNLPTTPASQGDVQAVPAAVWAVTIRTLSSFGTLAGDVWAVATRALTDKAGFGLSTIEHDSLVADGVVAVWGAGVRTLSDFGTLASDVWTVPTRVLTDKTGFSLSAGEHTTLGTEVQAALTAQGLTTARVGLLDRLDALISSRSSHTAADAATAVWGAVSRTLTGSGGSDPTAVWSLAEAAATSDPTGIGAWIVSKLALLGAGGTVTTPAIALNATTGDLTLRAGESYETVPWGNALVFLDTLDRFAGVTVQSATLETTAGLLKAGVLSNVNGHLAVTVELTSAETLTLRQGVSNWMVRLTVAGGESTRWQWGRLIVHSPL